MADDEFPNAEEPLLEHAIDVDGLEASASLRRTRSGTPAHLRLTTRNAPGNSATPGAEGASPIHALAIRHAEGASFSKNDAYHELEVEVLTEAVADAVADAVGEAVHDAVQEAVQTAIEESRFDFKANVSTIIAVAAAVLLERGIWNTWDYYFGDETLASNLGSLFLGLAVLIIIRLANLPILTTVPGR